MADGSSSFSPERGIYMKPDGGGGGGGSQDFDRMLQLIMGMGGTGSHVEKLKNPNTEPGQLEHLAIQIMGHAERARVLERVPLGAVEGSVPYLASGLFERAYLVGIDDILEEGGSREKASRDLLLRTARGLMARYHLAAELEQQQVYNLDMDQYTGARFTALQEHITASDYGAIFEIGESRREMHERFGSKVERALDFWKTVAEGDARIKIQVQQQIVGSDNRLVQGLVEKVMNLPNIFSLPDSNQLLMFVIEKYIVPSMGSKILPEDVLSMGEERRNALKKYEERENGQAAVLALMLIKHWDLDIPWGVASKGVGKEGKLTAEFSGNDHWKAYFPEVRRLSEYVNSNDRNEKRREHPRPSGALSTLGCYPVMSDSVLGIVSTTVEAESEWGINGLNKVVAKFYQERGKKWSGFESLRDPQNRISLSIGLTSEERKILVAELEKVGFVVDVDAHYADIEFMSVARKQRIPISIYDQVWSSGKVYRLQKKENPKKGEDPYERVEYNFKSRKFREIPWGELEIRDRRGNVSMVSTLVAGDAEKLPPGGELVLSMPDKVFYIPYSLQLFLAGKMFGEILDTDFAKKYQEVTQGGKLLSLNKTIDNALGLLGVAFGLDKDTLTALNRYVRVIYLAGIATATIGADRKMSMTNESKLESFNQLPDNKHDRDSVERSLLEAARRARFLTFDETKGASLPLEEKERRLFDYIIKHRGIKFAPTPFELKSAGIDWFSDNQLRQLREMYPLER